LKNQYLELLKKYKIIPTFPCSEEYFQRAKIKEEITGDFIYWKHNEWILFPPINMNTGELLPNGNSISGDYQNWATHIWASFPNWSMPSNYKKEFLELEHIYNPRHFLDLTGNKFQVFRKNIRKFPGRYGNSPLQYIEANDNHENQLKDLFIEWLKNKEGNQEIHDDEVMTNYIFNGNNRKILVDKNGYILGINIWDSNYFYINFRFSFSRNIKFLNEYQRYLFYTDPVILNQNKLVNDGGIMGIESLRIFKDKLCPVEKREIYSYVKIGD